jgi:lysozyme
MPLFISNNINKPHITQQGLNLIKRFEGFESEIYLDAAGLPTIGYGHLIRKGEHKMFENGISEAAGKALLIKDVLIAEQAACRLVKVPLTDLG